jgi:hypothetical protein
MITTNYFLTNNIVLSMVGDIPIDSETFVVTWGEWVCVVSVSVGLFN